MTVTVSPGFTEAEREQAADLFWTAFAAKLGKVLGPPERALPFVARILDPRFALVARDGKGRMLGLAGFKTDEGALAGGSLRDMAQVYGWFGALWRGLLLSVLERELEPGVFQMDGIFVAPEARGQGVGTALLDAIKAEAEARQMQAVHLDVIDINPRAKALYERQGFRPLREESAGLFRHIFGFRSATRMVWPVPRRV